MSWIIKCTPGSWSPNPAAYRGKIMRGTTHRATFSKSIQYIKSRFRENPKRTTWYWLGEWTYWGKVALQTKNWGHASKTSVGREVLGCPCSKLLQRMPRLPSLQEDLHLHNKPAHLHVDSWNNTWDPAKEINYGPCNIRCLSFRRLGRLKPESPSSPTLAFPICHAESTLTHKPPLTRHRKATAFHPMNLSNLN